MNRFGISPSKAPSVLRVYETVDARGRLHTLRVDDIVGICNASDALDSLA